MLAAMPFQLSPSMASSVISFLILIFYIYDTAYLSQCMCICKPTVHPRLWFLQYYWWLCVRQCSFIRGVPAICKVHWPQSGSHYRWFFYSSTFRPSIVSPLYLLGLLCGTPATKSLRDVLCRRVKFVSRSHSP